MYEYALNFTTVDGKKKSEFYYLHRSQSPLARVLHGALFYRPASGRFRYSLPAASERSRLNLPDRRNRKMKRHERRSSLTSLMDKRKRFPSNNTPWSPVQAFQVRREQVMETIQSRRLRRPRSANPSSSSQSRRSSLRANDVKVTKALLLILKERRELEAKKRKVTIDMRVRESVLTNRAALTALTTARVAKSSSSSSRRLRARPRSAPLRRRASTGGILPLSRLKHHVPWEWYYRKKTSEADGGQKQQDAGPGLKVSQSTGDLARSATKHQREEQNSSSSSSSSSRKSQMKVASTPKLRQRPKSASVVNFAPSTRSSTFLTGIGSDDDEEERRGMEEKVEPTSTTRTSKRRGKRAKRKREREQRKGKVKMITTSAATIAGKAEAVNDGIPPPGQLVFAGETKIVNLFARVHAREKRTPRTSKVVVLRAQDKQRKRTEIRIAKELDRVLDKDRKRFVQFLKRRAASWTACLLLARSAALMSADLARARADAERSAELKRFKRAAIKLQRWIRFFFLRRATAFGKRYRVISAFLKPRIWVFRTKCRAKIRLRKAKLLRTFIRASTDGQGSAIKLVIMRYRTKVIRESARFGEVWCGVMRERERESKREREKEREKRDGERDGERDERRRERRETEREKRDGEREERRRERREREREREREKRD